MKRKTVYRLVIDRVIKNCDAIAQRGYVDQYVHGGYSFEVCYMSYGHGWMSAVGGVMCVQSNTLRACADRTSAALADMIERGRLPELLAMPMVLEEVLENGGSVSRQKYDALRKQYLEVAEGMLDA